jgi:hypothetical protein
MWYKRRGDFACVHRAMMVTENHRNCYSVVVLKGEEPGLLKVGHIVPSL